VGHVKFNRVEPRGRLPAREFLPEFLGVLSEVTGDLGEERAGFVEEVESLLEGLVHGRGSPDGVADGNLETGPSSDIRILVGSDPFIVDHRCDRVEAAALDLMTGGGGEDDPCLPDADELARQDLTNLVGGHAMVCERLGSIIPVHDPNQTAITQRETLEAADTLHAVPRGDHVGEGGLTGVELCDSPVGVLGDAWVREDRMHTHRVRAVIDGTDDALVELLAKVLWRRPSDYVDHSGLTHLDEAELTWGHVRDGGGSTVTNVHFSLLSGGWTRRRRYAVLPTLSR